MLASASLIRFLVSCTTIIASSTTVISTVARLS